jgi:acyl-CoA synthetase (AMP-forming)/AMP-acid ligase II
MENNIAGLLDRNVALFGEYEQFIYLDAGEPQKLTNKEILLHSRTLATGLQKIGINKGDIVGTIVSNILEIPELINGISRCGAVYLPIVFVLMPAEINYILKDSGCKVLITEHKLLQKVLEAAKDIPTIEKIVVIGGEIGGDKIIPYADLMKESDERGNIVPVDRSDTVILMYTSGTTGVPKGVMLSHLSLEFQMKSGVAYWGSEYKSRGLVTLPMNHIMGMLTCLEGNEVGSITYMMQPFDPRKVLDAIRKHKLELVPMVPTMIINLIHAFDPEKDDLSSLGPFIISAGGPLSLETIEQAKRVLHKDIRQAYGCTETAGSITRQHKDLPFKPGSVGWPLAAVTIKIVDENGKEVPRGAEGEVTCKSPMNMKGYLNKPKETADCLINGWFHTGDLGHIDEDGELFITGRKKDIIIKGGDNIDPGVSEALLFKHPAVKECAVIGMKDAKYGEEVAAAVTLKPGAKATEEEVLTYLNQHLKPFVAPKKIFFFAALPKTGLGKILKREIRRIINEEQ